MSKIICNFGLLFILAALTACKSQTATTSANPKDLAASVEAAQTTASHFGDEALTCDAIQKEFASVINDPALQAYVAQSGMEAQNPEWARVMAAQSGTPLQQARAAQTAQKQMERMSEMAATVMPQVMRAQRLMELSAERKCAWMTGSQTYTPTANDARH